MAGGDMPNPHSEEAMRRTLLADARYCPTAVAAKIGKGEQCDNWMSLRGVRTLMRMSKKTAIFLAGLGFAGAIGSTLTLVPSTWAATAAKPVISAEASAAVARMGKTLLSDQFSFQVRTLRVYAEAGGQPLHIAHSMLVKVRRPDRLRIDLTGDDGATELVYDGKMVVLMGLESKKYASIPVPATIQGMLETIVGKKGVDFPLADLLTDAPDKAFLLGVTSGRETNIVTIDGVPCDHWLFTQPPGIEIELWTEKNDRAVPRRLVITYRDQPGQPSFIAELSDWNFSVHPADADFAFQPPEGAVRTELMAPESSGTPAGKGSR
jgi:hypothetical protein